MDDSFLEMLFGFNQTDILVLKAIGNSDTAVSPYELQEVVNKSYNVIHKSVKKIFSQKLLQLNEVQSEKSGKKTLYSLNLLGFSAYFDIIKNDWPDPEESEFPNYVWYSQQGEASGFGAICRHSHLNLLFPIITDYARLSLKSNDECLTRTYLLRIIEVSLSQFLKVRYGGFDPRSPEPMEKQFQWALLDFSFQIMIDPFYHRNIVKLAIDVLKRDSTFERIYTTEILYETLEQLKNIQNHALFLPDEISNSINNINWKEITELIKLRIEPGSKSIYDRLPFRNTMIRRD